MASHSVDFCSVVDDSFGPYAGYCRGGFDFTLLFEETILTIAPLASLFIASLLRLVYLSRQTIKVYPSPLFLQSLLIYKTIKVCYVANVFLQLALVVLWTDPRAIKTQATTQTNSISLLGSVLLIGLSYFEHLRSVKPSFIICGYFFFCLLFDTARARTIWLLEGYVALNTTFTIAATLKLVLLLLESVEKRSTLREEYQEYPAEATSGPFNRSFSWWLNPLFKKAYSKTLAVDDLFTLDQQLLSENLYTFLDRSWQSAKKSPNGLLFTTLASVKWSLLLAIIPRLCFTGFNFCQPFLIEAAISISQQPITSSTTSSGIGLIGACMIVYIGIAVCTGQVQHLTYRTITMARGGLIAMLYSKTADLSASSIEPSASVILMSADIERITTGWERIHELWANLIEIALAIYLLQRQLGVACTVPVAVTIFSMFGGIVASGLIGARQAAWLEAIERRIKATTAMLSAMKGIKMCGLTDILSSTLQALRVEELNISKKFRQVIVWNMIFSFSTPVIAPILTFATYSLLARRDSNGESLDTARVFTSLTLFTLLSEPLGSFIMALANFMGAVASFQRIQEFFNTEVRVDDREVSKPFDVLDKDFSKFFGGPSSSENTLQPESPPEYPLTPATAIVVRDGSFGWDQEKAPILKSINLTVPKEKFTMLIGPVGCGKSTLIKAFLGETFKFMGSVQICSSEVAYCDQTFWHTNGTVQQSIIGVSSLDERWYQTVIEACALEVDLKRLPKGDRTQIGSNGIALSGGQSQRIALARAIYSRQDVIILDDALRGLDADTENRLFHNILGPSGLLRRHRATVLIASSVATRLPYADHIIVLSKDGNISEQGTFSELNSTGGYVSTLDLKSIEWTVNDDEILPLESGSDQSSINMDVKKGTLNGLVDVQDQDVSELSEDDASRRMGDTAVYMYYISAVGWIPTAVFIVCIDLGQKMGRGKRPGSESEFELLPWNILHDWSLALIFLLASAWQMIITMVPRSGAQFHWILLKTVLSSPMSFFSSTDIGVTLNRFSQDLQLIDMDLPLAALNTFALFILCIAQIILISVASMYTPIAFPFILLVLYFIQRYYLRTSRQLRFLDIEAKAPLYSNFLECLNGLITIRAFGWGKALEQRNLEILDQSQRPFYQLFLVQRWLVLVLDLVVAAIAVLLMVLVVALRGKLSAGFVGVALLNVILFSQSLKLLLTFWTEVETHIGAIARIKSFTTNAETEDLPSENQDPPPEWPAYGAINFNNVSAAYKPGELVLKDITLSIPAGQKVGICGRTGSGKSSLLLALFRMLSLAHGSITIDGQDISLIRRQSLRSRLNGIPQDAYFLAGSIRLNADPRSSCTDKEIVKALKSVQLWDIIRSKGSLDTNIEDVFLSHGQQQLFCIARAILRKSTILVLDEATSSVDAHTDELIQTLIRQHFSRHTILSVAHKLDTILDFDQVIVMDAGSVCEMGEPYVLLENEASRFAKLYYSSLAEESLS
ncbi:multidrug resistance protein MDR [Leptodontidium sp. MPI-SDFR-AT-0119]|nr:multidrug resistance protein MDR [Leptodontidium sp. MPI-SDFR-AT-0119]